MIDKPLNLKKREEIICKALNAVVRINLVQRAGRIDSLIRVYKKIQKENPHQGMKEEIETLEAYRKSGVRKSRDLVNIAKNSLFDLLDDIILREDKKAKKGKNVNENIHKKNP